MDSFGKLLRKAREQKNLTLDDAAEQTSISVQYINALESENVDTFPGEPYAIGFLKNYSEFLDLDSTHMMSLFRAKRIQEAPTPIELIAPRRPAYLIPLIVFIALIFVGGIGLGLWFLLRHPKEDVLPGTVIEAAKGDTTYDLSEATLNKRVYIGDMLVVPHINGDITLKVTNTLGSLTLETPVGAQFVELGEERELDIDGIAGSEVIVFVSDISRLDATRGAEVRVILKADVRADIAALGETQLSKTSFVIFADNRAYPFVANITFRGICLLRYQSDRNDRIEDYYANGETLTVQANNGMRFWISNNAAMKLQIVADGKTHDLDLSRLGRVVVVCDILWVRDNAGAYHLAVNEID